MKKFTELMRSLADINYSLALLQWDQEVYMPENGSSIRAQQIATLSGIAHKSGTSDELGDELQKLNNDNSLTGKDKKNVSEALRNFIDRKKYTTEFVMEMSHTVSESFQAWQHAKKENDYKLFAPHLKKLVDLKKKECEILGYIEHPYDALLNQFEPGLTTAQLKILFADVKKQLIPFVKNIFSKTPPDDDFTRLYYPSQKQWDFGMDLLKQMGFDFKSGRQDISTHPFTINFNSKDVRVTTRVNENDLCDMVWSCIHEVGHALYEQGLPFEDYGLPSGEYLSLGIHESQSRLWENNVGRSEVYWNKNFPLLKEFFPEQLQGISLEQFYRAINKVEPSFIRTSADELTYHFHVMIRFEIETGLIDGSYSVENLREIWNQKYFEYMGIVVPDDTTGILQDVHWSHGSFGYFPTYSLGSFYAAQFFNRALVEIPNLEKEIQSGNMSPLLNWLRDKIHIHGRQYTSNELCKIITGKTLDFEEFMKYATKKYEGIY